MATPATGVTPWMPNVNAGPSANEMFRQLLAHAEPLGLTAPLWDLNNKYVYVQDPGLIIDQETRFKASPSAFKEHLQAPMNYQERQLKADGSISFDRKFSRFHIGLKYISDIETLPLEARTGTIQDRKLKVPRRISLPLATQFKATPPAMTR